MDAELLWESGEGNPLFGFPNEYSQKLREF